MINTSEEFVCLGESENTEEYNRAKHEPAEGNVVNGDRKISPYENVDGS